MTVLPLPACICWSNCCQFSAHTVDPRNLRLACRHLPLRWTLRLRSCYTSPVPGESIQSANPRILTLVFLHGKGEDMVLLASFSWGRHSWWRRHTVDLRQFSQRKLGCYHILCSSCASPLSLLLLVAFSVLANAQGTEMGRCSCPSLPWRFQTLLLLPSL